MSDTANTHNYLPAVGTDNCNCFLGQDHAQLPIWEKQHPGVDTANTRQAILLPKGVGTVTELCTHYLTNEGEPEVITLTEEVLNKNKTSATGRKHRLVTDWKDV